MWQLCTLFNMEKFRYFLQFDLVIGFQSKIISFDFKHSYIGLFKVTVELLDHVNNVQILQIFRITIS